METARISESNPIIAAETFFDTWCKITNEYKNELLKAHVWYNAPSQKTELMERTQGVYDKIDKDLNFAHRALYHSDALFFYPEKDLVPDSNLLMNIRIALEHENDFWSDLKEELSHLLFLNCELRVLISYPHNYDEKKKETLSLFYKIISSHKESKIFSNDKSILLIFGTREDYADNANNIFWEGYIYNIRDSGSE
jgi:hypothetical protein